METKVYTAARRSAKRRLKGSTKRTAEGDRRPRERLRRLVAAKE